MFNSANSLFFSRYLCYFMFNAELCFLFNEARPGWFWSYVTIICVRLWCSGPHCTGLGPPPASDIWCPLHTHTHTHTHTLTNTHTQTECWHPFGMLSSWHNAVAKDSFPVQSIFSRLDDAQMLNWSNCYSNHTLRIIHTSHPAVHSHSTNPPLGPFFIHKCLNHQFSF